MKTFDKNTFSHKAKVHNMNWEDIQEMQQQKKAHKKLSSTTAN